MSGQLILGKDIANDKYVPISVDSTGHLDIDVQVADLDSKCMGSETGATDGTQHQLRVDNQGHLQVDVLTGGGGDATSANQATQITNQGTINTSIGTVNTTLGTTNTNLGTINTSVGTVNSTLGDTNSKIDAMRGSSDLGAVNTSIGTVNSSVGDTNSKIDAMRATDSLTTVKGEITSLRTDTTDGSAKAKIMGLFSGGQYQVATDNQGHLQVDIVANADTTKATSTLQTAGNASLTSVDGKITACNTGAVVVSGSALPTGASTEATALLAEAHLGNIENNLSSIQSTVTANKLQVDVISSALPTGASTEATALLAEAHLGNIDTATSSIQSNVSTSSNQGTMITSLSSLAGCVAGTELQVDIVSGGGGGTQFAGEASLGSTGTGTAMIGRDNTGTARLVAVDTGGNIQMDIVANADTTKATSTLQTAGNASLTSVAGCVSGTELQVDVKNRTDSIPVALTFSAGNKIIGAGGTTRTGTIDVAGCSSYVIFMNMLVATTNSAEFANTDISIEYSPDDGSTFMGTVNMSGSLEMVEPKALYQASGTSGGTVVGYGIYIQATNNMASPLMGNARTNKIRLAVQNPFAGTLTLDTFAIYKFN